MTGNVQQFDYSVDVLQAILWQYDAAPNIQQLLTDKQTWWDANQTQFWVDFYNTTFNLSTAGLFGLAIWSYILDLPLSVSTTDVNSTNIWGFNNLAVENSYVNFTHGNFSNFGTTYSLSLEEQRLALRIRAYQLVSAGTTWDVGAFLQYLFDNSPAFFGDSIIYTDNLDMTVTYTFNWNVPYGLRLFLVKHDILPRPAGVQVLYVPSPFI